MPSGSDHTRRDAEHAARSDIRVQVMRYIRRMDEEAKAHIAEAIAKAEATGADVDGTSIGKDAAARAISVYMADGEPQPAIDASPVADDEPELAALS